MVEKSLSVLIAARVDDILVLRRLLRDSSYRVDPATGATQALRAITQHAYSAVVADDEALGGIAHPDRAARATAAARHRRLGQALSAVHSPLFRRPGARRVARTRTFERG